jgi:hypothetical protein
MHISTKMIRLSHILNEWKAEEVLQQLGGNKFIAMTGAKSFVKNASKRALSFRVPRAKNGINFVRILLTGSDLYTLEFYKARGADIKLVSKKEGVYNDRLQSVFTKETGLYTSL